MGKKKQKQARPNVTDVSAVKRDGKYVVSRSYGEVVDLISEGEVEGIVSGSYSYEGNQDKVNEGNNPTGYDKVTFTHYTATGDASTPKNALGFLRSVYWNNVPVVDKDGYYNFASVNVDSSVGLPAGHKPTLNTDMNNYTGLTDNEVLDLSVYRSVGERLYGPEIEGGDLSPTDTKVATLKAGLKIDKYSKTYSILNKECSSIELRIKIAGLFEQVQAGPKTYKKSKYLKACAKASTGYGDMKARSVSYNIYYQPIFDERFVNPSSPSAQKNQQATNKWLGPIRETVTGKLDSPYIRTTAIPPSGSLSDFNYQDLPGFEGWRIRIVRTTPESLTSFLRNTTFIDSITEIYGTTLLYPYSSMIYSQFDARSFSRIPSRAYDTKLIKVKVPNNYDPLLKTYGKSDATTHKQRTGGSLWSSNVKNKVTVNDPFWDGEFKNSYFSDNSTEETDIQGKYLLEWTDNPAWCFYDMLTNPRYGLGEYLKENEIDKWALYEIAQYCDTLVPDSYGSLEPRFTINYIITNREEAYKVMNDLASIFRGMIFYANGSIFAVQDKYKKAVYQFNNSNVADGNFTYSSSSKKARHTVAIVRYNDKRDLFKPAIEYVENEEAVRRYGIREIETSALGCTSRGQARRFAQWILASEAEETETVSFSAGQEGAYLQPGDVVQVYDNFRSPLKYSGRTNAVVPGVTDLTATKGGVITPPSGNNFNSIILDQALNFEKKADGSSNLYRFSILTPTYNYNPSNTNSLNTSGENEIRRSQVQNLLFSGAHAQNVTGSYRSDYTEGGSGVCTQIFFNTGTFFGGSGNVLNFDDYVITGYTNTGVATSNIDHPYVTSSYSGGCFSGENLIWSVEPYDPNDTEFISGNFSNYRVINVKENEGNTYDVSALAYSTGKYDQVENSIKLGGKNVDRQPIFNTGIHDPSAPTTVIYPAAFNIVGDGEAYSETTSSAQYVTIQIDFDQAGYTRDDKTPDNNTYSIQGQDDDLQYIICKFDYADRPTDDDNNQYGDNRAIEVNSTSYREKFLPFVVETLNGIATYKDNEGKIINPRFRNERFNSEILVTSDVDEYYIVIFAISPQGVLSLGYGKRVNIDTTAVFSIVDNILINNLKTEGNDGGTREINNLLTIEAAQPGFTWDASVKGIFSAAPEDEQEGDVVEPRFPLYIPQDSTEYRITIRKPSEINPNKPSDTIYVELTGYNTQSESPSFVFNEIYNNPSLITGYREDPHVTGWRNGVATATKTPEAAEWLSISGSGFNILNDTNPFPIRSYDVVVEAHDREGTTSAGNKVFQNTLLKGSTTTPGTEEGFGDGVGIDKVYDILGVNLAPPESVMYTQITGAGNWQKRTQYLSPENAYLNNLPYLAQAYIYPNGWLEASVLLSESTTGTVVEIDGVVQDEAALETKFNNAEGMVYYYTTGDNSVKYVDTLDTDGNVIKSDPQMSNPAPAFNISLEDDFLTSNNNQGNAQHLVEANGTNTAFGGIVNTEKATNSGGSQHTTVHRGFYLFSDGDTIDSLRIPFPNISRPQVANIQLSYAFFDEYHLLSAFEEDGSTPKTTKKQGNAVANAGIVQNIFTEKDLNFSKATAPLLADVMLGADAKFSPNEQGISQSIYLTESSVQSAQDVAGGFRAWGEIFINSYKLKPTGTENGLRELSYLEGIVDIAANADGVTTILHNCQINIKAIAIPSTDTGTLRRIFITVNGFPESLDPLKTSIHFLPEISVTEDGTSGLNAILANKSGYDLADWKKAETTALLGYTGKTGTQKPHRNRGQNDACLITQITSTEIVIECAHLDDRNVGKMPNYRIKFGILVTDE